MFRLYAADLFTRLSDVGHHFTGLHLLARSRYDLQQRTLCKALDLHCRFVRFDLKKHVSTSDFIAFRHVPPYDQRFRSGLPAGGHSNFMRHNLLLLSEYAGLPRATKHIDKFHCLLGDRVPAHAQHIVLPAPAHRNVRIYLFKLARSDKAAYCINIRTL